MTVQSDRTEVVTHSAAAIVQLDGSAAEVEDSGVGVSCQS